MLVLVNLYYKNAAWLRGFGLFFLKYIVGFIIGW